MVYEAEAFAYLKNYDSRETVTKINPPYITGVNNTTKKHKKEIKVQNYLNMDYFLSICCVLNCKIILLFLNKLFLLFY